MEKHNAPQGKIYKKGDLYTYVVFGELDGWELVDQSEAEAYWAKQAEDEPQEPNDDGVGTISTDEPQDPQNPQEPQTSEFEAELQIKQLEKKLADGDYKVIKCAEAKLMDKEMPYDLNALVEERNALRKQINELQGSEEE